MVSPPQDLTCDWMLEATGNVRFTIFANFFDVVGTTNCAGGDPGEKPWKISKDIVDDL